VIKWVKKVLHIDDEHRQLRAALEKARAERWKAHKEHTALIVELSKDPIMLDLSGDDGEHFTGAEVDRVEA